MDCVIWWWRGVNWPLECDLISVLLHVELLCINFLFSHWVVHVITVIKSVKDGWMSSFDKIIIIFIHPQGPKQI